MAGSLAGCAGGLTAGERHFRDGDYVAAAEALHLEETENPLDAALKRRLAASWLRAGFPDRARTKLTEALALDPMDPVSWFLMGDIEAEADRPKEALEAYRQFVFLGGKPENEVRGRIDRLVRGIARREVRDAIANEPGAAVTDSTVAVSPFLNVAESEPLASLSAGLAAVVITDLRKVEGFRVLERERIGVLVAELELAAARDAGAAEVDSAAEADRDADPATTGADGASTDAAAGSADGVTADGTHATNDRDDDRTVAARGSAGASASESPYHEPPAVEPTTAPRWGRLLQVRTFVQGFFTPLADDKILLGADLVSVDGFAESAGAPLQGALKDVLFLEKGLVHQILETLGVETTEDEDRRIDELATYDPNAFLAYARGLSLLDRGRTADAHAAFQEAVRLDPGFTEAVEAEVVTGSSDESFGRARDEIWEQLTPERRLPELDPGLIDIAVRVGGGPAPDGSTDVAGGAAETHGDLLGPADPDRIPPRTIPTLPPPPAGGSR
ncbi:MAG: tetratricopeptide repeat protein [Candidatus Eisenbacteria bacterium]